jgi:hypothetical protein
MRTVSGPPSWTTLRTESRCKVLANDRRGGAWQSFPSLPIFACPSGRSLQGTKCVRHAPVQGSRDMPAAMHRCCLVFPVNGMPAVFRSCSASPDVTKARAYPAAPFESLKKRYFISRTHPNGPAHRILQFCTVHPRQVRVARLESRRAQYPG